jgi:hypothetical protein
VNIGSMVRLIRQSLTVQENIPPENVALVGDCRVGTIPGKVTKIPEEVEIVEPVERGGLIEVGIEIGANLTSYRAMIDCAGSV